MCLVLVENFFLPMKGVAHACDAVDKILKKYLNLKANCQIFEKILLDFVSE